MENIFVTWLATCPSSERRLLLLTKDIKSHFLLCWLVFFLVLNLNPDKVRLNSIGIK